MEPTAPQPTMHILTSISPLRPDEVRKRRVQPDGTPRFAASRTSAPVIDSIPLVGAPSRPRSMTRVACPRCVARRSSPTGLPTSNRGAVAATFPSSTSAARCSPSLSLGEVVIVLQAGDAATRSTVALKISSTLLLAACRFECCQPSKTRTRRSGRDRLRVCGRGFLPRYGPIQVSVDARTPPRVRPCRVPGS